jgi:hypothetical protein
MSTFDNGYAGDSLPDQIFLLTSHGLLLPSIRIACTIIDYPWLLIDLLSVFIASNSYHSCYSFDVCYFDDKTYHRALDNYCAKSLVITSMSLFLWRRRKVYAEEQNSRRWRFPYDLDRALCHHTLKDMVVAIRTHQHPIDAKTEEEACEPVPPDVLEYYRPWTVDAMNFVFHVLSFYLQVQQGRNSPGSVVVMVAAATVIGLAHLTDIIAHGVRLRAAVLVIVLFLWGLSNLLFFEDEAFGARGHSLWHVFGFSAAWVYYRSGPVFSATDKSCVRLRRQ